MKQKLILLSICFALLGAACNNSKDEVASFDFNNTCWFDGYEFFVGGSDTTVTDVFNFAGGTLHEGGSTFSLRQVAVDTFVIQPTAGTTWVAVGVEGDTVVREPFGSLSMLVCHRPNDPECDTLWQYDPGDKTPMEAYEQLLLQKRIGSLTGTYYDAQKKLTYQFFDTFLVRINEKGVADTQSFHFFYSFDMPSHILQLSNSDQFWYELTPKGMDLYDIKYWKQEEDFTRESLIAQLERQK